MEKKDLIPKMVELDTKVIPEKEGETKKTLVKRGRNYKSVQESKAAEQTKREQEILKKIDKYEQKLKERTCFCDNCDDHPFFSGENC